MAHESESAWESKWEPDIVDKRSYDAVEAAINDVLNGEALTANNIIIVALNVMNITRRIQPSGRTKRYVLLRSLRRVINSTGHDKENLNMMLELGVTEAINAAYAYNSERTGYPRQSCCIIV